MKANQSGPAILALLCAVILTVGLNPMAGLAQSHSNFDYSNGTYVINDGMPAPGYLGSSTFPASNPACGQEGTYIFSQGSLAPANQCDGGSQHQCTGPASCPEHAGHGSCC